MTQDERLKSNARRLTNYYLKQGRIVRQPCHRCGAAKAEKHHHDYTQVLDVEWLCRLCHRREHVHPTDAAVRYDKAILAGLNPTERRRRERELWHKRHNFGHSGFHVEPKKQPVLIAKTPR